MTNLKFDFMEGLILTKDGEMLDQTINSIFNITIIGIKNLKAYNSKK